MAPITIRDGVSFARPVAAPLAALFEEAELEFEARTGAAPVTRDDWKTVVREYGAKIVTTPSAAALAIRTVPRPTRERTIAPRAIAPLADTLTPFAQQFAAALDPPAPGLRVRVISAADAVAPFRQILARYGWQDRHATHFGGPTWYERPEVYLHWWTGSESAIVLTEDDRGPRDLHFLTRLADRVVTRTRIGGAADDMLGSQS